MERGRLPNRLKQYRHSAGLSQKKVIRVLGLTDTSILSRWERGITSPSVRQVLMLSRLYNTFPHDLYHELWQSISPDLFAHTEQDINQELFYL